MTDLEAILTAHHAALDCLDIVGSLLVKSRKGAVFHHTVFFNKSLEQAQHLLLVCKEQLADATIVSLLSTFERIVFDHPGLIRKSKDQGLNEVIKHFKDRVSTRTYHDIELLCGYRHWVAHGKRWPRPSKILRSYSPDWNAAVFSGRCVSQNIDRHAADGVGLAFGQVFHLLIDRCVEVFFPTLSADPRRDLLDNFEMVTPPELHVGFLLCPFPHVSISSIQPAHMGHV